MKDSIGKYIFHFVYIYVYIFIFIGGLWDYWKRWEGMEKGGEMENY
jgi:hypothetical protein